MQDMVLMPGPTLTKSFAKGPPVRIPGGDATVVDVRLGRH